MKTNKMAFVVMMAVIGLMGCSMPELPPVPTHKVIYDANGFEGGILPVDNNEYPEGSMLTVAPAMDGTIGWCYIPDMLVLSGNTNIITSSTISMGYFGDVTLYALWKKTDTTVNLISVADISQTTDVYQINGRGSYYDSVGADMLWTTTDGLIIGSTTYVNEACYTGLDALYSDGQIHNYPSTNPSPVPPNKYFESPDHLVFYWAVKQGSTIDMMIYFPESEAIQNAPFDARKVVSMIYHE